MNEKTDQSYKSPRPKPVKIDAPLAIVGFGDFNRALQKKLFLIGKFKLAEPNELLALIKLKSGKTPISTTQMKWLEQLWKHTLLDDLDLAELFVSFVPQIIENQGSKFIEFLDPNPSFHRKQFGEHYDELSKASVIGSSRNVSKVALPRVRAKLALKEIICLITSNPKQISELVSICARYLTCPQTAELITKFRSGRLSHNPNIRKNADVSLNLFSKSILGKSKRKARKYGYWKVDYFFNEVLACIKNINEIKDKANRLDYIRSVNAVWGLPSGYQEILKSGTKNPAELTLEIMIAKGLIQDASTYRNVIKPHVKKIKGRYPHLGACDPIVEHILDLPTKDPDRFDHFDLWKQLESFTFDLTDKEIEIGHSISYPGTTIRV